MADESPGRSVNVSSIPNIKMVGLPIVLTSVELKLSRGLLPLTDDLGRVTGEQDSTLREAAKRLRKDVKVRLVRQTDAVLRVLNVNIVIRAASLGVMTYLHLGQLAPGEAVVGRPVNLEVRLTAVVVVLPSGQQGTLGLASQLRNPGQRQYAPLTSGSITCRPYMVRGAEYVEGGTKMLTGPKSRFTGVAATKPATTRYSWRNKVERIIVWDDGRM